VAQGPRILAEALAFPEGPVALADGTVLVVSFSPAGSAGSPRQGRRSTSTAG